MNLSAIAIKRPVFTVMVTLALLVLGGLGLSRLGTDLFPDVSFPVVLVNVVYPGASPAEVETQVEKPLEDAVISLNGIDRVQTFSRESLGTTVIIFKLGVDIQEAATQVRERVAQTRIKLPAEIKEPAISRIDVSATPVLTYTAFGPRSLSETRKYADDVIRPALEQLDGVAAVNVRGGADREIKVNLDRARIDALGLSPEAVIMALKMNNLNVPAAASTSRRARSACAPRASSAPSRPSAIWWWPTAKDGSAVRLRDVADVEDGWAEMRTRIRSNGEEAVAFEVVKQSGRNTVAVSDLVKARLTELEKTFPRGHRRRADHRSVEVHPRERARGRDRHRLRRRDGHPHHPRLHARSALDHHQRLRPPHQRHRHLLPDVRAGLHAQHDDAARPLAGHRPAHRRRRRRPREHLQAPRAR
jgi:HAE1 family hydrophobic/amphiphilic exporter-1